MRSGNPCRLQVEQLEQRSTPILIVKLGPVIDPPTQESLVAIFCPMTPPMDHGAWITAPAGEDSIALHGAKVIFNVPQDVTVCLANHSIMPSAPVLRKVLD